MLVKLSSKGILLLSVTMIGIILVFLQGPIPQNKEYHHFSDARDMYHIPNFCNVISNVLFVLIGLAGLFMLVFMHRKIKVITADLFFFLGIFFTGIGSSCYHWAPSNDTLVWDRLPMTISFMAFFSIIVSTYISEILGKRILWPLLFIGVLSVLYWQMTESLNRGDLRLYVIIQFLPMLLIPLILLLFRPDKKVRWYFWMILLAYGMAKAFELLDAETLRATGVISGHSIKHLLAALAPCIYFIVLFKRYYTNKPTLSVETGKEP